MYTYMRFLVNLNLAQYMVSRWFLLCKFNYNFGTCLDKLFTTLMSTQVKLQKDKMMWLYMVTTKPFINRLQNTNSFLLVECISRDCSDTLVCVQPSRIFPPEAASFPLI